MGATIITDAFWGDAGKGKFCAFLSKALDASLSVRAGTGANAGHSFFRGKEFLKTRMLPLGWVNPKTRALISSGVAINPAIFLQEVTMYGLADRAFIDKNCPVIEKKHILYEEKDPTMIRIDSTKSGSGMARADYVMRRGKRAKDIQRLEGYLADGITMINEDAKKGNVVIEGSQATFLSLYASDRYPFVTSDNCTTNAFLDDTSLNWRLLERVILLVKCLPTCVGNGFLPFEMSTEEIKAKNLVEYGVNTGRVKRRSSKIDWKRLAFSVMVNGATEIALTFCDQYDSNIKGCRRKDKITPLIKPTFTTS